MSSGDVIIFAHHRGGDMNIMYAVEAMKGIVESSPVTQS